MTRQEFKNLLKEASLEKKDFCSIIGLNYDTVNTWGSGNSKVPKWVKSWLENYIEKKKFDKIKEMIKDEI